MKNLGQYIFEEIQRNDYFKSMNERILRIYASKIIDDIEEYQKKNGIASFTATVLELVRKGLEK